MVSCYLDATKEVQMVYITYPTRGDSWSIILLLLTWVQGNVHLFMQVVAFTSALWGVQSSGFAFLYQKASLD